MSRFFLILLCAALSACGTNRPSPFIVPHPFQLSQPFQGAERNEELLASITETASVVLEPIEGLSPALNEALAVDILEAAQGNDIPLSSSSGTQNAEHLSGRFEPWVDRGNQLNGTIIWRLQNADGELLDTFEAGAVMQANAESELTPSDEAAWREVIAQQTSARLGAVLDARPLTARRRQGLDDDVARRGPPILVPSITGAPGDGDLSLTRSVRALLEQQGVNVIDPQLPPDGFDASAAYTLSGAVGMGTPNPEAGQPIAISWDLYGPDGGHLGNVAQQNQIEPGSLDGPWGEVAIYAAMGAVDGILTLLSLIPSEGS